MKFSFDINMYDYEGDIYEKGIYIFFNDEIRIKVAEDVKGFQDFIMTLQAMEREIEEAFNFHNK